MVMRVSSKWVINWNRYVNEILNIFIAYSRRFPKLNVDALCFAFEKEGLSDLHADYGSSSTPYDEINR